MREKRMRGRPTGTGVDDQRFLDEVADLLLNDPRMKPTAAMRHVIKERKGQWTAASEEAMKRRLQVKWKAGKGALQMQAKERSEEAQRSPTWVDIVNIGLHAAQAFKAWQTPENIAGLQRAADGFATMLNNFGDAFSHVKPMIINQEMQRNFSEVSRQMEGLKRISVPSDSPE
ncbi:hypothetical protein [Agrobacterium rosae]|uniref:Uncharacterized protein n=1 Tax=Agrobacterium rosae TaxID=1972867 RepID=A0A1R3U234_9HYPH|nr:hypothetical protein [Agrobacterium rosae]SCX31835.1 hypothetical protein DSM25559_3812 [Agrobacterium rosae]